MSHFGVLIKNKLGTVSIEDGSITASKIAVGAVGNSELAVDAVDATKIAAGAVGNSELAVDAVTTDKILNGTIASGDLAAGVAMPLNFIFMMGAAST